MIPPLAAAERPGCSALLDLNRHDMIHERDAMRCSVFLFSILLGVVCQTRAEVETPDEIMFLDSNYSEIAKYAGEFTSYYPVEESSVVELYVVDQARDAMYASLFAILNCKFAFTMARDVVKVPSRNWDDAVNLADSLSLGRAINLSLYGFNNLTLNCEILDRAVERLRAAIALMNRVALVSSARDALEVMVDTRDRLEEHNILGEDQLSDSAR